jgi:hypothetical protein
MPFNLIQSFEKLTNEFANTNYIVYTLGNPCILSIMIVLCIILIMYSWDIESELIFRFKFIFYLLIGVLGLMIAHDTILKYKYKDSVINTEETTLVNNVHEASKFDMIEPRKDIDTIRTNIINDMPETPILNSSDIL